MTPPIFQTKAITWLAAAAIAGCLGAANAPAEGANETGRFLGDWQLAFNSCYNPEQSNQEILDSPQGPLNSAPLPPATLLLTIAPEAFSLSSSVPECHNTAGGQRRDAGPTMMNGPLQVQKETWLTDRVQFCVSQEITLFPPFQLGDHRMRLWTNGQRLASEAQASEGHPDACRQVMVWERKE